MPMITAPPLKISGIAGSLRKGSFNRATLKAAVELAPPGMTIEIIELGALPLKNAIDWGSRIPDPPYVGKATAMISASVSPVGGVRAQYHLRHMCVSLNCFCMNTPQVYIGDAAKKFDANLKLIDAGVREELTKFLAAFRDYIVRLKR